MIHINKLESNGYEFQIFHLDNNTSIKDITGINQSYLMSARFFPLNEESQRQCEEIFNLCTDDILEKFHQIMKDNHKFYQNFSFTDNFSNISISAYQENFMEKINFMEVFYQTELK